MILQKATRLISTVQRYLASPNRQIRHLRRIMHRHQVRYTASSDHNGEVKVVDLGRERRLLLDGRCHSFGMTRGSESELYREYWGHLHRVPFELAPHPRVLMCGLGGGTGLKVLTRELQPATITVLELDPVIVDVARRYFGVGDLPHIHILTGDEVAITTQMGATDQRFDLIVEDAMCLPTMNDAGLARAQLARLVALLAPGGCLVFNGPVVDKRMDPQRISAFCEHAHTLGLEISTRDVGQRWWFNRMVYARLTRPIAK